MRIVVIDNGGDAPISCGIFRLAPKDDLTDSIAEVQRLREQWADEDYPDCFGDFLQEHGFVEDSQEVCIEVVVD